MAWSESDNPRSGIMRVPPGSVSLSYGVGPNARFAPYGETLQATGRTTRVLNRPKRVCDDALPANSVGLGSYSTRKRAFLAGTINLPWLGKSAIEKATFLLCWEDDISTLP